MRDKGAACPPDGAAVPLHIHAHAARRAGDVRLHLALLDEVVPEARLHCARQREHLQQVCNVHIHWEGGGRKHTFLPLKWGTWREQRSVLSNTNCLKRIKIDKMNL